MVHTFYGVYLQQRFQSFEHLLFYLPDKKKIEYIYQIACEEADRAGYRYNLLIREIPPADIQTDPETKKIQKKYALPFNDLEKWLGEKTINYIFSRAGNMYI